ncbi:MAG: hypothetical protein O7G31_09890 [Calditrichaeota bacterium]|nr:hypothetical protein [Calditrichota bacterium]
MRKSLLLILLFSVFSIFACSGFVEEVDPLINQVEDDRLDDASQVDFLIKGVLHQMSKTADRMAVYAGALSDELVFDQDLPRATFPSFDEINRGEISLDNNSVDGLNINMNEGRFFADDLVDRTMELSEIDAELLRRALYTSYLVGGLMRQYMGSYWGITENEPGGVLDVGPFVPQAQMYALALEKYDLALGQAADDFETRVVQTLIARVHFYGGDFAAAGAAAALGLRAADGNFDALYNIDNNNEYFFATHDDGRIQFIVDDRYQGYVVADPEEAARLPLLPTEGTSGKIWYYQNKFPLKESPFPVASWQENELMLAEVEVRNGGGDPLTRVNDIRASFGMSPLAAVDLDVLYSERERTLWLQGFRLLDQLRFDRFHLAADKWHHFPITERERSINPNID